MTEEDQPVPGEAPVGGADKREKKVSTMTTRGAKDYRELLRSGQLVPGLADPPSFRTRARRRRVGTDVLRDGSSASSREGTRRRRALRGPRRRRARHGPRTRGKEALLTLVEPPAWFGEIAVFDGLSHARRDRRGETTVLQVPRRSADDASVARASLLARLRAADDAQAAAPVHGGGGGGGSADRRTARAALAEHGRGVRGVARPEQSRRSSR